MNTDLHRWFLPNLPRDNLGTGQRCPWFPACPSMLRTSAS